MNFNAFLWAIIFLHFRILLFYNNPPWLFKAIPFNHTSAHLRRELTGEKVAAWCFALVGFDSAAWPQKGYILPAHSPWLPPFLSFPVKVSGQRGGSTLRCIMKVVREHGEKTTGIISVPFSPYRPWKIGNVFDLNFGQTRMCLYLCLDKK